MSQSNESFSLGTVPRSNWKGGRLYGRRTDDHLRPANPLVLLTSRVDVISSKCEPTNSSKRPAKKDNTHKEVAFC